MSDEAQPSFTTGRRWSVTLNVVITTITVLAIILMLNYLASRHFRRFDWSGTLATKYSPLTKQIIESLTNEVRITVYFGKDDPLYDSVTTLLKDYHHLNNRITLDLVDYISDPAAGRLVKTKYKLESLTDKNLVIFQSTGGKKFVYQSELTDYDTQGLLTGQSREVRRTHFRGEMLFTSAILSVTTLRPLKAYFLQGHGEHKIDSADDDTGYARFASLLKDNNIDTARLTLLGTNDIPSDCNLLVLAGPMTPLGPPELNRIEQYLKNGGRLMALFNIASLGQDTGLERILNTWGVDVGRNQVKDPENTFNGQDLVSKNFGDHPITRPLNEKAVQLVLPRSIRKIPARERTADGVDVVELLSSGPNGMTLSDIRSRVPFFDPLVDVKTNIPVAVAVEKGKIRGVAADRGTTRIIVLGDSYFLANKLLLSAANQDFLTLCINWLLDRTELLQNLGPRPIKDYKLEMTTQQITSVRWLFLAVLPGSVLALGTLVWFRRRH